MVRRLPDLISHMSDHVLVFLYNNLMAVLEQRLHLLQQARQSGPPDEEAVLEDIHFLDLEYRPKACNTVEDIMRAAQEAAGYLRLAQGIHKEDIENYQREIEGARELIGHIQKRDRLAIVEFLRHEIETGRELNTQMEIVLCHDPDAARSRIRLQANVDLLELLVRVIEAGGGRD